MKHLEAFDTFLDRVVNLNSYRLGLLDTRVQAIADVLKTDTVLGESYKDHIPQGSWAHQTIIRPVAENDEFDADFLLHLKENSEWTANPKDYLRAVRAALKRSNVYKDKIRKKNRCVRVVYANDCHIDVVPSVTLPDGRHVIVNYAENKFELTNPEGFTDWMKEKDTIAQENLRRVIRLMKYLRDFKNTFSCPSIILTSSLGDRVQVFDRSNRYTDVPTTLMHLIKDLSTWMGLYPMMPIIEDPSCAGTTFNHRWSEEKYQNFKVKCAYYSAKIEEAYQETDEQKSLAAWQTVFGDGFKLWTDSGSAKKSFSESLHNHLQLAPQEQFIEDKYPFTGGYSAKIDCTVKNKDGFGFGLLRVLRRVNKGKDLVFKLRTDTPEPYDVFWKVRNHGEEAARLGQLRGQLIRDEGSRRHNECTQYLGEHYVEAYVVKNGTVVASDHQDVRIH